MDEERKAMAAALLAQLINDNPDSLEIGTPAKGGGVKVYGNYGRPDEFRKKIDAAVELKNYARIKIGDLV